MGGGWSDDHHISPSTFGAHPPTKENRAIKTSLQPIEVGKFLADCDTWTSFGRCRTPTLGVLAIGEKWCRAVDVSGRMYDRRKIQIPLYVKHLYIYIYISYDLYIFIKCMFLFHAWLFDFVYLHFVFIDVVIGVWINQNYAMPLWETTDGSHERFPVLVVFPHHPAS